MMKIFILTILLVFYGCVNPLDSSRPINKKANKPPTITNTGNGTATVSLCSDSNATNFNKKLPCTCTSEYIQSNDGLSCIVKYEERSCQSQPENSYGGFEFTQDAGNQWSSCENIVCNDGFIKIGNTCALKDIKRTCISQPSNSYGGWEESINAGIKWGSCSFFSCNNGYANIGGVCTEISQKRICSIQPTNSNNGFEYTKDSGLHWTSCQNILCNEGFTKIGETCSKSEITRNCISQPANSYSGIDKSIDAGLHWSGCDNFICKDGYTNINGVCKKNEVTRSCTFQPENSSGGIEISKDTGLNWSSCSDFICKPEFSLIGNKCVKSKIQRSCLNQPSNSINGWEESIDAGIKWGSCQSYSCNEGYADINGQCIALLQKRICSSNPENANEYIQISYNAGLNWNECSIISCNEGYNLENNKCIKKVIVESLNYDPQYYIKKFESSASKRHIDMSVSINIVFDSSLSNTSVLGMCVYSAKRYISLNPAWWNSANVSNSEREYAMFHELGHCTLNRGHKNDMTNFSDVAFLSVPKSMMYPSIINNSVYKNNIEYYHDELFDPTMSTQNIALYYDTQAGDYASALVAPIIIKSSSVSKINGKIVCAHAETTL